MAATFRINGTDYPIVTDPTLGEAVDLQTIAECPIGAFDAKLNEGDIRALIAALYVSMRRVNPRTTLEDVQAIPLANLMDAIVDDEAATLPPADAAPLD